MPYLHIAQLRERFVAIIKSANKWLQAFMSLFMRSKIASLSKAFRALTATIWFFTCMAAHMSLQTKSVSKQVSQRRDMLKTYPQIPTLGKGKTEICFSADLLMISGVMHFKNLAKYSRMVYNQCVFVGEYHDESFG
jgi:hypothetical protein